MIVIVSQHAWAPEIRDLLISTAPAVQVFYPFPFADE
jgi:hypothetical protein